MTQVSAPQEGSLAELPLSDLLAAHARARTSGRLVVKTIAGDGELRLWDGSVAEARFGPAEGETALMRLIAFREGTFSFEARPVSAAGLPSGELQNILEKAKAHHDEVEKHASRLGGLQEVFELDLTTYARRKEDIPAEISPVMSLVDGRRTVQQIVAGSDLPDVTVLRVLRKLRSMGLLRTHQEALEAAQKKAQEAEAAAARAAAASTPPVVEAPKKEEPKSFEEMLLLQFQQKQEEHAALLEQAVPESMRSLPPRAAESPEQVAQRTRAAEDFAGPDVSVPPAIVPGPSTEPPAPVVAEPPTPVVAEPPVPVVTTEPPPAQDQGPALLSDAPPPNPVLNPPTGKDAIRLKKSGEKGPLDVSVTRWTERPDGNEPPAQGDDDTEDELPAAAAAFNSRERTTDPQFAALMTPGSRGPAGPATTPVLDTTPPSGMQARGPAPSVVAAAAPSTAHHHEDDHFFSRASNPDEIAALAEREDAAAADPEGSKFFFYVVGGVGAVTLLVLAMMWSSAPPPEAPPVHEVATEAPKPAIPRVVATDMGAEVKTGEQALREISRAEAAKDVPPEQPLPPTKDIAAQLAGQPVEKAAEPAPAPVEKAPEPVAVKQPEPAPAPAPAPEPVKPVEKAPEPVAAKQPEPVKPVEKAPEPVAAKPKPVEKAPEPAKPADDPKKLFTERYEKGVRLLKQENYEDAKRAFESALKLDPGSGRAYTSLGQANYELGNLEEALKFLRKGESLEPGYSTTYLVLGLVQQERGDLNSAEKAYEKYLAISPNGSDAKTVQNFLKALRAQKAAKGK